MPWNLLESEEGDLLEHEDGTLVTDEDGAPCCCGGSSPPCCQNGCGFDLAPFPPPAQWVELFDWETTVNFPFVSATTRSGWIGGPTATKRQTIPQGVDVRPCFAHELFHTEEWGTFVNGTGEPKVNIRYEIHFGTSRVNTGQFWPPYPDPAHTPIVLIGELPDPPTIVGRVDVGDAVFGGLFIGFALGIGEDTRSIMWAANRTVLGAPTQPVPTFSASKPTYTSCNRIEWTGIDGHVDPDIGSPFTGGGDIRGDLFTVFHAGLIACGESTPLPANCERCRFPLEAGRPNCANCGLCNGCG